jgi:phosphoglycolate phosphatase
MCPVQGFKRPIPLLGTPGCGDSGIRAPFAMRPVRLIIFDLDGTLVNTLEDIAASVNFTLGHLGLPALPVERVRQCVGDGVRMLLTRALDGRIDLLGDAEGIYKLHHAQNLSVHSRLYPGVRETLEHFRFIDLAVVSNKTSDFVGPLLKGLGVERYFRVVLGADSGMPLKPAPDSLLYIMKVLKVPKDYGLMVGDGTTDIRAGRAAGVTTCAVSYGFRSEAELREAGPDLMIDRITSLSDHFRPER